MVVVENPDRAPLAGEEQLRKPISIQIAPAGAADEADTFENFGIGLIERERAILIPEYPRTDWLRIVAGLNPAADEKLQIAVPIHIANGQRPDTGVGAGDGIAHFASGKVIYVHTGSGRHAIFIIRRAGEQEG